MKSEAQKKIDKALNAEARRFAWGYWKHFLIAFTGIVVVSVLAITDEYECSKEHLSGVVSEFDLVKDSKYRSVNMHRAAVIKVSDGAVLHWPSEGLKPDERIELVRCTTKLFGKVEYRRSY